MIGNPVNYDKKDSKYFAHSCVPNLDSNLKKYLTLLPGKEVLDIGIGKGHNSIVLSSLGYNVTGVDYSKKSLDIVKDSCSDIKLFQSDIRNFEIEPNIFDLIMSVNVLHFLHKDDASIIFDDVKNKLKVNGLVYISVFSISDPSLKFMSENHSFEILDNNIAHKLDDNTYFSYFSKDEILKSFHDFKTIFVSDVCCLDLGPGKPHYHGVINYIGQKIN